MPVKSITNPLQAWTSGATWGTLSGDNEMTQAVANLLNGSGAILYTGDIVAIDVTGTQAILPPGAGDPRVIGVVGGTYEDGSYYPVGSTSINILTMDGYAQPAGLSPAITASMGLTNGSGTVTYASAAATDIGKQLTVPYNSSTNANPQIYTITAVSAGVSYTVTPTFNGTTGSFNCTVQMAPSSEGPGWPPSSSYPVGVQVPVVIGGFARININGVAGVVASDLIAGTSGSPIGARTAAAAATAAQIGTFIAVTLEAYAARLVGVAGHDTVRAWITKF